jgi:hypothetical protein
MVTLCIDFALVLSVGQYTLSCHNERLFFIKIIGIIIMMESTFAFNYLCCLRVFEIHVAI